jgi:hypothetical protein
MSSHYWWVWRCEHCGAVKFFSEGLDRVTCSTCEYNMVMIGRTVTM